MKSLTKLLFTLALALIVQPKTARGAAAAWVDILTYHADSSQFGIEKNSGKDNFIHLRYSTTDVPQSNLLLTLKMIQSLRKNLFPVTQFQNVHEGNWDHEMQKANHFQFFGLQNIEIELINAWLQNIHFFSYDRSQCLRIAPKKSFKHQFNWVFYLPVHFLHLDEEPLTSTIHHHISFSNEVGVPLKTFVFKEISENPSFAEMFKRIFKTLNHEFPFPVKSLPWSQLGTPSESGSSSEEK